MTEVKISIRQARPNEAERIAEFIIMAMTEECCLHFCGPHHDINDFRSVMTSLVARDDTQYSYLNTLVADDGGSVIGICVSYDGALLHQLRQPFIAAALRNGAWTTAPSPTRRKPANSISTLLRSIPPIVGEVLPNSCFRPPFKRASG